MSACSGGRRLVILTDAVTTTSITMYCGSRDVPQFLYQSMLASG
jgi:hypothetical protein